MGMRISHMVWVVVIGCGDGSRADEVGGLDAREFLAATHKYDHIGCDATGPKVHAHEKEFCITATDKSDRMAQFGFGVLAALGWCCRSSC